MLAEKTQPMSTPFPANTPPKPTSAANQAHQSKQKSPPPPPPPPQRLNLDHLAFPAHQMPAQTLHRINRRRRIQQAIAFAAVDVAGNLSRAAGETGVGFFQHRAAANAAAAGREIEGRGGGGGF
ncbi:hypothetical protein MMC12_007563 [Toensbergia leucococca]|nr:hypothetical protein [Toensbergia leucococca]